MTTISYLTPVHFDFGAIRLLKSELARIGVKRPLIVTDRGVRAAGLLDPVMNNLDAGTTVNVFDATPANPTEAAALAALEVYRAHACDGVIGLGGGSSMDLAKAVALVATHPLPLVQYAVVEGGAPRITAAIAPVIAIPTTAGTGSEVGRAGVIVFNDGRKLGLASPNLYPRFSICDPELTLGLPKSITAGTGMDAIAHCIETYLAPAINPPAEAIALDGLTRAVRHLETAVADGSNREARWNMMMAAMEGAMAFQKGLGAVHSLSHPLGALPGAFHHGTLNAVLLPPVLEFNAGHVGDKMATLARVMGLARGAQVPDAIRALNQRIGLPAGLRSMGVPRDTFASIAAAATKDHCHPTNPRPVSEAEYEQILMAADH